MRGITQLTTGKFQARCTVEGKRVSCGVHATHAEAAAALHARIGMTTKGHATHANGAVHRSASGSSMHPPEISCSTTPTPETTASPSAGTTERQPGRLADSLSPASIALLHEVMAAAPTIPSMDRAADRALAIFRKYMWEQQTNPDWIAYKQSLKQP